MIIKVIEAVCDELKVTEVEFFSQEKKGYMIDARFIAGHLCTMFSLGTLEEIGRKVGDKSHSTIISNNKKSAGWVLYNKEYAEKFNRCKVRVEQLIKRFE